jgi:hypothetical protein
MIKTKAARRVRAAGAGALALSGLLGVAQVALVVAAQSSATVLIGAQINAVARVEADRSIVTVEPGRSVTVVVVVKARLARGSAATVMLDTPGADRSASVRYEFAGNAGVIADRTVLGAVNSSGVHTRLLTITVAPTARRPVTLPLVFRVGMGGTRLMAAGTSTQP